MEVQAPAKLNLTLDVLGKRPDGYHDLRMVMQTITLADRVVLEPTGRGEVRVQSDLSFLPGGEKNLAGAAALRFYEALGRDCGGLDIALTKRVPVCAGMAGGSSDAAAVLRALNELEGSPFTREELCCIGEQVGSDVPYCVMGGTALAEGRGEVLTPLPALPACLFVLCKPRFSISTPALFRSLPVLTAAGYAAAPIPRGFWPPWRRETWGAWPGGCTTSLRTCWHPGSRERWGRLSTPSLSAAPWGPT